MQTTKSPSIVEKIFANAGPDVIIAPPVTKPVEDEKTATPPMYSVMLLNDPSTPFDFVCEVLEAVFLINKQESHQIMMGAHRTGKALVRVYSREVAETKVQNAMDHVARRGAGRNCLDPSAPCELCFTSEPESDGE